jgi:hypothetical protein
LRVWAMVMFLLLPTAVMAGNSPRDYACPLDPGTFFFAAYYNHTWGTDYYSKGKYQNGSTRYYSNVGIARPVYFTQVGPFTADPQMLIPFGQVSLDNKEGAGLGDPILASTFWFINDRENGFVLGYTPFLYIPLGTYDRKNLSLGSNRWSTKQEVCVAKRFGDRVWWEVAGNVTLFSDNPDANDANNRSTNSSKNAVFGAETHVSVDITKSMFVSADYYYTYGGETSLHGVWQKDWTDTHTVGLTVAYMLAANVQLMANFNTDVSVYNGVRTNVLGTRLAFWF